MGFSGFFGPVYDIHLNVHGIVPSIKNGIDARINRRHDSPFITPGEIHQIFNKEILFHSLKY